LGIILSITRKEIGMAKPKKHPTPSAKPAPVSATITIEEAARYLQVGRNQAYQAAHKGELPVIRIGKRLLVPVAALNRLLGKVA
jgi:excisionase family DNA binding protein